MFKLCFGGFTEFFYDEESLMDFLYLNRDCLDEMELYEYDERNDMYRPTDIENYI